MGSWCCWFWQESVHWSTGRNIQKRGFGLEKIWLKSYPPGTPHDIDVENCGTLLDLIETMFKKFPEKPAYANFGKVLTYGQIDHMSMDFAAYLQGELRLKKGDRVAIMMPNLLQYPIALFGILRAGLIVVNVNPLYTARELEHQLKDSGAKAIVILENFASVLQKVMHNTQVSHVVTTQIGDCLSFFKGMLINFVLKYVKKMVPTWHIPEAVSFAKALASGSKKTYTRPEIEPTDLAFLQYTGGTTGVSKGAMLTHRNLTANITQVNGWIGAHLKAGEEIILTPLPLYHIFSLTANCLTFGALGALNVLITNPRDMPNFIKEMGKWRFTCLTGVNTLFNGLLNTPGFSDLDFSNFKMTLGGGMAVQKPVAMKWKEVTGKPLIEAYGLTETSPAAVINPLSIEDYSGYIGLPIPSTLVVLRDEHGKDVPLGEPGELCVKGPQVMPGYWNRPGETEKTFYPDGFLRTGDIATMSEEGYLKIVDRMKDMILVSGFNVYPNEIEDVVASHPGVLEVAAIGIPDPKSTEAVKLIVVRKDPDLTEEQLMEFCRENFTGYKRPRAIAFRESLPKTNVGKILRRALREEEQKG